MTELASRLRSFLALLPVRFDDVRFWPRAALGLVLRQLALQLEWSALRQALTTLVVWASSWLGLSVEVAAAHELRVAQANVRITVPCTHAEVFLMLAPLLWDARLGVVKNLRFLTVFALLLVLAAFVRIQVAVLLFARGVPWLWAHDVELGVAYFLLLAFTLRRGAWTMPARDGSQRAGGGR